ncbi:MULTISPECIES: rhamnosyltransferase [Enterobacter]|uniref:Glycosyl transferase family protein n=1 Tax=Enterobacter bugandensis TaxID=881260 RepID=A0A822WRU6_9ENTR|nr:rhamnosyltransferase [Enterobacter bugandensis]MBE3211208.1 rhamnosyltransferase [Enterobacter cloacae complex sp. P32C]MBY6296955.1 rhamnosyltransferase [Enterobacter bugandensis]MCK7398204.1 rhamnosyltransferase [Enterobacter bugandensis]MCK7431669.1 rhamnosyltransferase [Enterobacter bugandensis]MCM7427058.1 rhamnosyltransferase [Enterobacter bugandensis]
MISSVTVTFNPDILCLEKQFLSLQGQIDSAVIIDNGSRNYEEIKDLAEKFNFVMISLPENMGLSHAQNIGIENAISRGAEYLLLLDQDSVLGANFISAMNKMYTQNNVGILGPSFYDPHTNEFYWGTNYIGPFIKRTPIEEITDVTYVIASGSFFSSEVYEKVGKMEEALFVDYIDVEWALRAKKLGYRVAMTNQASMAHTIGDSRLNLLGRKISVHSPMRRYFLVRNSFFMIRKSYIPVGYKVREVFLNFARAAISLILNKEKKKTLMMIFYGISDGLSGRFGPFKRH